MHSTSPAPEQIAGGSVTPGHPPALAWRAAALSVLARTGSADRAGDKIGHTGPMTVERTFPAAATSESEPTGPQPPPLATRMASMPVSAVREILKVAEQPDVLSFAGGLPAPELFPVDAIAAAHAEVLASAGGAALQYSTTEGYGPLRDWIAGHLQHRGIAARADELLITSGSQQ